MGSKHAKQIAKGRDAQPAESAPDAAPAPAPATLGKGRQTTLTPEVQHLIVLGLQSNMYFKTACEVAGVAISTGLEWIARGEGRDPERPSTPLYAAFADAVKKAKQVGIGAAVHRITEAAKGGAVRSRKVVTRQIEGKGKRAPETRTEEITSFFAPEWQADAWVLERTHPDLYGRRNEHKLSSPGSDKVEHHHEHDVTGLIDRIYSDEPGDFAPLNDDFREEEDNAGTDADIDPTL